MKKNTLIVNLIGAPGTGKTTLMAEIFAMLKWEKIDSEMVSEFAKELVWEERHQTFKDELYIFAKQNHRFFRVNGKVDVIITDRPLMLTIPYNRVYGKQNLEALPFNVALENLVIATYSQYNNFNIYLKRTKPYNPNGRNQTEKESDSLAVWFKDVLEELDIPYISLDSKPGVAEEILKLIKEKL